MNNYSIRIPEPMMERLKQESAAMEMSVSELIRALLRLGIDEHLDR